MQQAFISHNSNICAAARPELRRTHKLKVQYRRCDNEKHTGFYFFSEGFFCFAPQMSVSGGELFPLCCRSSSREPQKKTATVDKENMALVRGPSASEDTASSRENKVSCKSGEDPTLRNHPNETYVLTVMKPQNRGFRKT